MAEHDLKYESQDDDEHKMFMKFDKEDDFGLNLDAKDRSYLKRK